MSDLPAVQRAHQTMSRRLAKLRDERDKINAEIDASLKELQHVGQVIRALEERAKTAPVSMPLDAVTQRLGEDFDAQFGSDRGKQGEPFKGLI